jgi:tol-pal system protein YbgF
MKVWIVISTGLLVLGCGSLKDVQILDKDLDRIKSRVNILQKENNSIKNEVSDLKAENQAVQADLSLRLENLESEIRIFSTSVEEYKELLKRPSKELYRFRVEMETRLRSLLEETRETREREFKEMEDRFKELDGKTTESNSKPMPSERLVPTQGILSRLKAASPGMGDLYRDAFETFNKGDLVKARGQFDAFLKQYPNTELSNNAQFWIGETYYEKKDFEKAILEYEKVITQYPEGGKIPVALFKEALAFIELGDKENARRLLRGLIERYPYSFQAEIARRKLKTIK